MAFTPLYTTSIVHFQSSNVIIIWPLRLFIPQALPIFEKDQWMKSFLSSEWRLFMCSQNTVSWTLFLYAIGQLVSGRYPNKTAMGRISCESKVLKVITLSSLLWTIYNRLLVSSLCADIGISIHCYPENCIHATNVVQTLQLQDTRFNHDTKVSWFSFKRIITMYSVSRIGMYYSNVTFNKTNSI